jgi:succinate dehydrogenase / fumarate reductase, cytochrome b subunit
MIRFFHHLRASIGSKMAVALTGLGLVVFVIFHMLGNLQIFQGAEAINGYAAFLRDMPMALWSARAGLLLLIVFHIGVALKLALRNRQARPTGYAMRHYRQASVASRTMAVTGLLLLLFIVFHVLHLTLDLVDTSFVDRLDIHGHRDVYGKMIHAFRNPWFVGVYLLAQVVLGMHLSHAVTASFQTLGLEHPAFNRLFQAAGPVIAWLVGLGNAVIVVAVMLGMVRL